MGRDLASLLPGSGIRRLKTSNNVIPGLDRRVLGLAAIGQARNLGSEVRVAKKCDGLAAGGLLFSVTDRNPGRSHNAMQRGLENVVAPPGQQVSDVDYNRAGLFIGF